MTGHLRALPVFTLAVFILLATPAWGQYTEGWAGIYYDEPTDQVVGFGVTFPDYSTDYYYDPRVDVNLFSDNGFDETDFGFGGAEGYASVGILAPAQPGVTYTVNSYHSVDVYYYYYDIDPWCTYSCYDWYDAYGYSQDLIESGEVPDLIWYPSCTLALVYLVNQYLGENSRNMQVTPTVDVTYASIPDDEITVVLRPNGGSGTLTVQALGGSTHAIFQGVKSGGTHNISFNIPDLPNGQEFTQVRATWTPTGGSPQDTHSYHFKSLGTYTHTRYNSPAENKCSGNPSPLTVYNDSCVTTPNAVMKSGFISQVLHPDYGTGSGHSMGYQDVLREALCSPRAYPTARRDQTIIGTKGPVDDTTVAVCYQNQELYVTGRQLYIHGLGVKTVTDRCPACCGVNKINNYTTDTECFVGSLPDAKTIILY